MSCTTIMATGAAMACLLAAALPASANEQLRMQLARDLEMAGYNAAVLQELDGAKLAQLELIANASTGDEDAAEAIALLLDN